MRKLKILVITMAAVMMVAGQVNAADIISLNFSENDGNQGFAGGENIGPLATDSTYWNNTTGDLDSGTLVSGGIINLRDDSGAMTGAGVTWNCSNTWWNHDGTGDDEHRLSVGYLDDGNSGSGNGVVIVITNIPYAEYRVYGLIATDQNQGNTPPTFPARNCDVNGSWVFGGDASTTADAYGTIDNNNANNGVWWTEIIEPGVTIGNYWTIETSGATCTITAQTRNGEQRGCLTAVIIENLPPVGPLAWDPDPLDDPELTGAEIPTDKTLSWKTGEDPNDGNYGAGPDPTIKGHYVYLTTDKAALEALPAGDETTFPYLNRGYQLVGDETYTPGVYNAVTNPNGLDTDKVYYWRIDERSEYGGGQEPNIWLGPVWTFQTTKLLPIIDEQPQDTAAFTGDPAEIDITVSSVSTAHYAWKMVNPAGEDPNVGTDDATLSFASAQVDPDEGQYYCVVTNDAGSATSTSAWLDVKRLVGRWQLNGDLTDSAGGRTGVIDPGAGYGGTPPADPNFNEDGIEDINGGNGQSYEFDDDVTEIIRIPGTDTDLFNFHKRSGLTVSAWVKTTLTSHWGAPVSRQDKTDGNEGWILNTSSTDYGDSGVMTIRQAHQDVIGTTNIKDNEWHLLTGTYNPATGQANIYIDGRWEDGWEDTSALSDVARPIVLGAETVAGDVAFDGLVDDVRIYNYPLNGFEIALIYTDIRQSETICPVPITIDYNNDCVQDLLDLEIFLRTWLECKLVRDCWSPDHPLD